MAQPGRDTPSSEADDLAPRSRRGTRLFLRGVGTHAHSREAAGSAHVAAERARVSVTYRLVTLERILVERVRRSARLAVSGSSAGAPTPVAVFLALGHRDPEAATLTGGVRAGCAAVRWPGTALNSPRSCLRPRVVPVSPWEVRGCWTGRPTAGGGSRPAGVERMRWLGLACGFQVPGLGCCRRGCGSFD
jgi:hypothetical protein